MRPLILVLGTLVLCFLAATSVLAQTAVCSDGWRSNSSHFQGTCSDHGGVRVWLNEEMEKQANEWCDNNPDLCANSHWTGIQGHGNHPDTTGEERAERPRGSPIYNPANGPLPRTAQRYGGSPIYTPGQPLQQETRSPYGSPIYTPGQPLGQEQSEDEENEP